MSWLDDGRTALAADRILDAAAVLFATNGAAGTGMDQVARVAGCSRATLYRYFDNRQALLTAFAHREARGIVELVAGQVAPIHDPTERAVTAIVATLAEVRARPLLHTWYAGADSALLTEILRESPLIESFAGSFAGGTQDAPDRELARWVIRAVLSFLAVPGADAEEEQRLIARFVAPHLAAG